ncbi:MAG TPA: hypothetical protein VGE52_19840, partial [Pirellulales bacterium]
MRTLLAIGGGLVATAWAAGLFDSRLIAAEPEPELLFTRKREFKIPFQIDPPKSPDERPVEVHLYMSDSRGVEAWPLIARVPPETEQIPFTARRDGEYWFVVRTIDAQGRLRPEGQTETKPELKVLVDATAPVIDLQGMASPQGEVIMLRWHVEDMFLASDRPTIEYRSALSVDAPWRALAINAGLDGEANIAAPPEPITVRAKAVDMAGNTTTCEMVIDKETKAPIRAVATSSVPDSTVDPTADGAATGIAAAPAGSVGPLGPAGQTASAAPATPAPWSEPVSPTGYETPATGPGSANYAAAYGTAPMGAGGDPFSASPAGPPSSPAMGTGPAAYGTDYNARSATASAAPTGDAALELFDGLTPGAAAPNIADPTARMPGSPPIASTNSGMPTSPAASVSPGAGFTPGLPTSAATAGASGPTGFSPPTVVASA